MKKILIFLAIFIAISCVKLNNENNIKIPLDSIRIRIIANSDNLEDQLLKLKVKSNIEKLLYKELENVTTIKDAQIKIQNNIPKIESIVKNNTENSEYEISFGKNYFPLKEYNGVVYDEGLYESLVVKLGEGKGKNWWCVLFPPLCLIDTKVEEGENIEYKSKILEILNKYQ